MRAVILHIITKMIDVTIVNVKKCMHPIINGMAGKKVVIINTC